MYDIALVDHRIVFCDKKGEKTLIDCWDCINNKSRIPVRSAVKDHETDILELIIQVRKEYEKWTFDFKEKDALFYMMIDALTARVLMRSAMPLRVLQIGSMDGVLSYHLAFMTGAYNPESHLCCVCSGIGNESGNCWLDWIVHVSSPPKLSMLAADYDDTHLQAGGFDLAVINGTEYFENPYAVLQEAGRLVRQGGAVLCYSDNQPLLTDCFRMIFGNCEEFGEGAAGDGREVLFVQEVFDVWSGESGKLKDSEIDSYLHKVQDILQKNPDIQELRGYISQLDHYVSRAMDEKRIDLKVRLMEIKGRVLDKMY